MELALVEGCGVEPGVAEAREQRRAGKGGGEALTEPASDDDRVLRSLHLGSPRSSASQGEPSAGLGETSSHRRQPPRVIRSQGWQQARTGPSSPGPGSPRPCAARTDLRLCVTGVDAGPVASTQPAHVGECTTTDREPPWVMAHLGDDRSPRPATGWRRRRMDRSGPLPRLRARATETEGPKMSYFLYSIGHFAGRHPWRVLAAWLVFAATAMLLNMSFGGEPDETFRIPGAESQRAADAIEDRFPQETLYTSNVIFHSEDGLTSPETKKAVEQAGEKLTDGPHVTDVSSPYAPRGPTVSEDGTTAFATVAFDHEKI